MHWVPSHHRSLQNIHGRMGADATGVTASGKFFAKWRLPDGGELLQKSTYFRADPGFQFERIPSVRPLPRNYISTQVTSKLIFLI